MNKGQRFSDESLPQPIAVAWNAVARALPDEVRAATCAQFAVEVTLRTLAGLMLAEPPPRKPSKTLRSGLKDIEKRSVGIWAAIVLGFAETANAEPTAEAAYAPFRAAVARWLVPDGVEGEVYRLQKGLVNGRNDRSHVGASHALDIGAAREYLQRAEAWLTSLRWLGAWQIVVLSRLEQPPTGPVLRSTAIRLVGRELAPVPRPVAWTAASAPWGQPILVAPGEGALLPLGRSCHLGSSATADVLQVPVGFRAGRIEVAAQDTSQPHRIEGPELTSVFDVGGPWLANEPQYERLTTLDLPVDRPAGVASGRQRRPDPEAHARPPEQPRVEVSGRRRALLLGAFALIAVASAIWFGSTQRPTPTSVAPAPTPPQLPTAETANLPIDATTTAEAPLDAAAEPDPLAAAREAVAACATTQPSEVAAPDAAPFDAAVALLLADEPRSPEAAAALHDALGIGQECGDRLALELATELRPVHLGLKVSDADLRLRRTLTLARAVAQSGSPTQRNRAALLAASSALQLHGAIDARGKVDDARHAERLAALLQDAAEMVCAVHARQEPPDVPALRTALGEDAFRTLALATSTPRLCALALLEDAEDWPSRRHWLALVDAGPRCCSATPARECGEPLQHCQRDVVVIERALEQCRASGVPTEARLDACEQALDLAERALQVRAALPAIDPRCLPRWAAPDEAARAVAAMRRSPAPDPASITLRPGHLPPKPQHDAAIGRWLAAVRAHGELVASLSRQEARRETLRAEARLRAIKAAKTLFALAYLPAPAGERPCPSRPPVVVPASLLGVVWDPRRLLGELEASIDPAVSDEAKALSCRAEAADGEAGAVQRRRAAGSCPP